jgi:LmbE family N-acetylglucosaminyl deacetylase
LRLLCLGAHSDDIEIGCGGTLLRLLGRASEVHVRWVVLSGTGERGAEAVESAERLLEGAASLEVRTLGFRDGFFPDEWADVKEAVEDLKGSDPDLVFTHFGGDRHQDHRVVSELTWNTFRDHLILEYEIPKWDGDLGRPSLYVPLDAAVADAKVAHLISSFPSQREKHWYDEEVFRGLLRLRGLECNAPAGYAEAFHARKVVLEP